MIRGLVAGAALAASTMGFGAPAQVDQMTVQDLREMCVATDATSRTACRFYILGAFQGLGLAGGSTMRGGQFVQRQSDRHFCVPDELAMDAMRDRVMALTDLDLKAFPDDARLPAISWIAGVIEKTYPCR